MPTLRHDDLITQQGIVNQCIPHLYWTKHIRKVDLRLICHRNDQLKQFQLILEFRDKLRIYDIVMNKIIPVMIDVIIERVTWKIYLRMTEFLSSNILQRVALLLCIGKLLVQSKIVKDSDTLDVNSHFFFTTIRLHLCADESPRTHLLHCIFTEDAFDSIDQIRNVEELNVPASNDVNVRKFPEHQELLQQRILICATDKFRIIASITNIRTLAKCIAGFGLYVLQRNENNFFVRCLWLRESLIACARLNVN